MSTTVLLADDDFILRELVDAALTRKGYVVTVADDGFDAVELIHKQPFDVVILDYHMPSLDGFGAARQIDGLATPAERPRLIGISADPIGLETRDEARPIFDAIVQKPINIPMLFHVIEDALERKRLALRESQLAQAWRASGLDRRPRARFVSHRSSDFRTFLQNAFDLSRPENPDCVLMTSDDEAEAMVSLRTQGNLFAVPFVDLSGCFPGLADAHFTWSDPTTWQDVATCVRDFTSRRLQLTHHFLHSIGIHEQLLAYIFVSGRDFRSCAPGDHAAAFPGFFPADEVQAAASTLVDAGLLRTFRPPRMSKDRDVAPAAEDVAFALTDLALARLIGAPAMLAS